MDATEAVKNLSLLRSIVAERVDLGKDDFGTCPFHQENTPSFHIFQAKSGRARYHCFGCGAQGDVFNYLQATEGLGFRAAANRLNAVLSRTSALPPEPPEPKMAQDKFCEFECKKYADLRLDYNEVLSNYKDLQESYGALLDSWNRLMLIG